MAGGDVRKLTEEQKKSIPDMCNRLSVAATAEALGVTPQTVLYHLNKSKATLPNCPLCACGCGQQVSDPRAKYIKGHSKRKLNQDQRDLVCELYDNGLSTPELSKRFGLTDTNIWRILRAQGVSIRNLKETSRKIPEASRQAVVLAYKDGNNAVDIAAGFGISFQEVYFILHEQNVALRKPDYFYSGLKGTTKMRSSWELEVANWMDKLGIDWQYEPKTFSTSKGKYTPDFYLPRFDCYVEVKGAIRPGWKIRASAFVQEYPGETLFVIYDIGLFGKMLLSQKILEKALGHNVTKMDDKQRIEYFRDQMLMFYAELAEMLQEWPWKTHKRYTTLEVNREKFLEETVDCLVFLLNAMAALEDVNEREVFKSATNVEVKNFLRAAHDYAGPPGEDLKGSESWKAWDEREKGEL